jgi:hypothetical protein
MATTVVKAKCGISARARSLTFSENRTWQGTAKRTAALQIAGIAEGERTNTNREEVSSILPNQLLRLARLRETGTYTRIIRLTGLVFRSLLLRNIGEQYGRIEASINDNIGRQASATKGKGIASRLETISIV